MNQHKGGQWSLGGGDRSSSSTGSGILSKLSMSLDAICYLVAFFLVDIFTFGRPITIHTTPTLEKQESPIDTYIGHEGRSVSEGDTIHLKTPLDRISRRSSHHSESSTTSLFDRYDSFSPERKSHREDYKDGALHHNQKAIFERQMHKTLLVQPYIKFLFICLGLTGWLILVVHFFGLPNFIYLALGHIGSFIFDIVALTERQLLRLFGAVLPVLPVPSNERTGSDVIKAAWSRL